MRIRFLALTLAAALVASSAEAKVVIAIDKSTQRMTVTVDGATRWTWPVSTGRRGRSTPSGTFRAFRMEEDHYSKEWDDAPMPHSIFFTKRGHAIHGSFDIKRIGTPASAGCVRLHPANAKQLFALVKARGVLNATVVISGEEPRASAPAVARRTPQRPPSAQAAPQPVQPRQRTVRQYPPQVEYYDDPRYGRPLYRRPGYPPPAGYYTLPPPPPGYTYAPQPAPPPPGYYYYYR